MLYKKNLFETKNANLTKNAKHFLFQKGFFCKAFFEKTQTLHFLFQIPFFVRKSSGKVLENLVSFQKLMYIFLFLEKVRVQGQYQQQIMNVVIFCCCKCKMTTFIYLLKNTLYFDYPFIICSIKVTYILFYSLLPILKNFFIHSQLDALSKHTFLHAKSG